MIKSYGAIQELVVSSERPVYLIMCYVPRNGYSRLESFVRETKQILKELFPLVRYNGNETPSFYDDEIKGHMVSIEYVGCRKIELW